ncbi:MAG: hypothetical protein LZF62_480067 [Nitrospira sp.]|nr:MAG: hypothetical protein LZF62_480067 [Nitrospira sp.]
MSDLLGSEALKVSGDQIWNTGRESKADASSALCIHRKAMDRNVVKRDKCRLCEGMFETVTQHQVDICI